MQPEFIAGLEAFIAEQQAKLDGFRATVTAVREMYASPGAVAIAAPSPATSTTRAPVAGGSIEDRLLSAIKAGATVKGELVAAAKAKPYDINKAINGLVAAKRIVRTGHSRGTRYALA